MCFRIAHASIAVIHFWRAPVAPLQRMTPAPLTAGSSLRYSFAQTAAVLGAMLLALLAAVLASLKPRGVH